MSPKTRSAVGVVLRPPGPRDAVELRDVGLANGRARALGLGHARALARCRRARRARTPRAAAPRPGSAALARRSAPKRSASRCAAPQRATTTSGTRGNASRYICPGYGQKSRIASTSEAIDAVGWPRAARTSVAPSPNAPSATARRNPGFHGSPQKMSSALSHAPARAEAFASMDASAQTSRVLACALQHHAAARTYASSPREGRSSSQSARRHHRDDRRRRQGSQARRVAQTHRAQQLGGGDRGEERRAHVAREQHGREQRPKDERLARATARERPGARGTRAREDERHERILAEDSLRVQPRPGRSAYTSAAMNPRRAEAVTLRACRPRR